MLEIKKQTFSEMLSVYLDKRMLKILLLGAISGFPWVLIGSSLSLWLKEDGLSRSTIGWAGLIFGVYAFNYLWAPLIDRIQIPLLTRKIGHRRGWIVLMQILILISLFLWSIINPSENLSLVILVGLIIAVERVITLSLSTIISEDSTDCLAYFTISAFNKRFIQLLKAFESKRKSCLF